MMDAYDALIERRSVRKYKSDRVPEDILEKIKSYIEKEKPDIVLVHGDTSTTFVTIRNAVGWFF